jgi:hypothetical protein
MIASLCTTCGAPMCEWLLNRVEVEGMKVKTVHHIGDSGHAPYDVFIVQECPYYEKWEGEK